MKMRSGFTLIELLVVISIIALLMSLLLAALGSAQEAGRTAVCLSGARQIAVAHQHYAQDHRGHYPAPRAYLSTGSWAEVPHRSILVLEGYLEVVGLLGVFRCPSDDGFRQPNASTAVSPPNFSYTRNMAMPGGQRMDGLGNTSRTVLLVEEWEQSPMNDAGFYANSFDFLTYRHQDRGTMSFLDVSVRTVDADWYNSMPAGMRGNFLRGR